MAEEPISLKAETPKENSIKKGKYPINLLKSHFFLVNKILLHHGEEW